jgi:hypothetical protein
MKVGGHEHVWWEAALSGPSLRAALLAAREVIQRALRLPSGSL